MIKKALIPITILLIVIFSVSAFESYKSSKLKIEKFSVYDSEVSMQVKNNLGDEKIKDGYVRVVLSNDKIRTVRIIVLT